MLRFREQAILPRLVNSSLSAKAARAISRLARAHASNQRSIANSGGVSLLVKLLDVEEGGVGAGVLVGTAAVNALESAKVTPDAMGAKCVVKATNDRWGKPRAALNTHGSRRQLESQMGQLACAFVEEGICPDNAPLVSLETEQLISLMGKRKVEARHNGADDEEA